MLPLIVSIIVVLSSEIVLSEHRGRDFSTVMELTQNCYLPAASRVSGS